VLEANKLSGVVARDPSGIRVTREVTNETDRVDAGDPDSLFAANRGCFIKGQNYSQWMLRWIIINLANNLLHPIQHGAYVNQ